MGVLRYNYRSEILGMNTDLLITYPSGKLKYTHAENEKEHVGLRSEDAVTYHEGIKFPTVWFLHGGGDDDTMILRYTNMERYAEEAGVMTVTAQVNDSFFLNTRYGIDYFDYLTIELPQMVQALFASSPKRKDNFVIGMAMGGNAALQCAMKRPDLYAACVDLSGGIGLSIDVDNTVEQVRTIPHIPKFQGAFGKPEEIPGTEYDLSMYARKNIQDHIQLPELYLAVGKQDFIRDVVRKDRDALEKLGIPFHYEEPDGYAHEWNFWDTYIKKALLEWLPIHQ